MRVSEISGQVLLSVDQMEWIFGWPFNGCHVAIQFIKCTLIYTNIG